MFNLFDLFGGGRDRNPRGEVFSPQKFVVSDSPEQAAAELLFKGFVNFSKPVVGVTACLSFDPFFEKLAELRVSHANHMHEWEVFVLDQLYGVPPMHPQNTEFRLNRLLFTKELGLGSENMKPHFIAGSQARDYDLHSYNSELRFAGRMDVVVLKLGDDGSIALNRPGSSFQTQCSFVPLNPTQRETIKIFSPSDSAPLGGFTAGMQPILHARNAIIVVTGADAADVLWKAYNEAPTERVPVSVLQHCPKVTIVADRAARMSLDPISDVDWQVHLNR